MPSITGAGWSECCVPESRRALLVVNTSARRGREWLVHAREALRGHGFELTRTVPTRSPESMLAALREAIAQGVPLAVVGGGDGTLSKAAETLAGTGCTLGVLPLGTGNALARDLGIPTDVQEACKIIHEGYVQDIDLGTLNGSVFVNLVTVGLSARAAQLLDADTKRKSALWAYAVALARAVAVVRPFEAKLELDGERHEFKTMQVAIGSGRFHAGPFPIAEEASITDGLLRVYVLDSLSKADFARYAWALARGKLEESPRIQTFAARSGTLATRPLRGVNVDGDVRLRTPIELGIRPGALRVLCSQPRDEGA